MRVDGAKVAGASDLVAAIAAGRPGDHLTLGVRRGSQRLSLDATLATQPSQAAGG